MAKNINNGQLSFFDDNCNPINPIEHKNGEIPYLNRISSVKKIQKEVQTPLLENLEEKHRIEEPLESLAYEMPFHFYDEKMIDPFSTRKDFSTRECIEFYLKIINHEPGYRQFQKYRETIEKYFVRSFSRSENTESLQEYMQLTEKIPEEYRDKIIVDFDGDLDFTRMGNNRDTKTIVNDILSKKVPFDLPVVDELLDKFFVNIGEKKFIDNFESFQYQILNFFENINTVFNTQTSSSEIESLKENIRKSYDFLFSIIFESFELIWKDETKLSLGDYDKYEFDDWFEEKYSMSYSNILREVVWEIISSLDITTKESLQNTKFLTPLFASYRRKGNGADLLSVFKRNIILQNLRNRKVSSNTAQEKQDRTNQFKIAITGIEDIEYDRGIIIHRKTNSRTSKEKFVNYSPREWKTKILEWIEESKITRIKIQKLENLMKEEDMLLERFNIDSYHEELFDKEEGHSIKLSDIFQEDEDCRKIKIFELVEEKKEQEKRKAEFGDDLPF